jgi:excinuclease ABC subunit C
VKLSDKLDSLPKSPGVYLFKDSGGQVIYVGKAKVLRHRVRSYFQKGDDGRYQYNRLVKAIADLEVIVTDSEMEALVLENNLIKQNLPRYNVMLRDDKTYPYLQITNELYPRVFVTRKTPADGSKYYGPYTDVRTLRELLRTFMAVVKIRNCGRAVTPEEAARANASPRDKKYRPCLNYFIGRCAGACAGLITPEDYAVNLRRFLDLVQGKDEEVIEYLRAEMEKASAEQRFEDAASWRDRLLKVEHFGWRQKVETTDPVERDVIALAQEDDDACAALFQVRRGRIIGRSHFYLTHVFEKTTEEILEAFLQEYYTLAAFIPEEIFLPVELENASLLGEWLSPKKGRKVRLEVPKIGEKARLVRLVARNAELLLGELKLAKSKKEFIAHSLKSLQRDLGLPKPPKRIECFDVSNIQGKDAVASLVCFQDAKPAKSQYRRFKIKSVEGADDFAMMGEAIHRHYSRVLREKLPLPDLLLVDGGKGQLNRAVSVLRDLGLENLHAAGLAKRLEEVFLPGQSDPQNVPKNSSALKLLAHVRDEAHRFAVTYHRLLRKKRTMSGELDAIPGIGEHRKKALLRHFGSLKNLKSADAEAIAAVPGINPKLAQEIHRRLQDADNR